LRGEERAEQGCDGFEGPTQGFEEAPVGLFGGDGCDTLLAGGPGLGGFFLAFSLAFAGGGAAFAGSFC